MLARLKKPTPDRDRLVILEDNGTADIAQVYDTDDQSVFAESATQDYAVPLGDLVSYVGPQGRIYLIKAESDYIADTKRLAALERSIVLRQVTQFTHAKEDVGGFNIKQIMLYALVGILLLAVVFR